MRKMFVAVPLAITVAGMGGFATHSAIASAKTMTRANTSASTLDSWHRPDSYGFCMNLATRQLRVASRNVATSANASCAQNGSEVFLLVTSPFGLEKVKGAQGPSGPVGPVGPQGPKGDKGDSGAPGAPAPVEKKTFTAATKLTDRSDSGIAGTWAKDNLTRTVTITRQYGVPKATCGAGATVCYYYTGTLVDDGTFTTIPGAKTPNDASKTLVAAVTGSVKGGTSGISFYSDSKTPDDLSVPTTGAGDPPVTSSTGEWVKQFFPAGTKFASVDLGDWAWTYKTPANCDLSETLINALAGNQGNITAPAVCS